MNNNLKTLRDYYEKTQKEFAATLGIPANTYNQYENGARDPKSDFWELVANKYKVSIDWLMGLSDNPNGTKYAKTFQISPEEIELITAWRNADRRAREDVAHALRNYGFSIEQTDDE